MKKYVIDSSSLIHFEDTYPNDVLPSLWDKIYGLFDEGIAYSLKEAYVELEDSQELWDNYKDCFRELSEEESQAVEKILIDSRFDVFKRWGMKKEPWADPYLIASALVNNDVILVTQENMNNNPERKIEYVCKKLKIPCINFLEFLRDVPVKV